MATPLPLTFTPSTTRIFVAAATKGTSAGGGSSSSSEEKGLLDRILGYLTKQDQFYETDPILKKVEGKSGGTTGVNSGKRGTVVIPAPPKKKGVFGGLFAKN